MFDSIRTHVRYTFQDYPVACIQSQKLRIQKKEKNNRKLEVRVDVADSALSSVKYLKYPTLDALWKWLLITISFCPHKSVLSPQICAVRKHTIEHPFFSILG